MSQRHRVLLCLWALSLGGLAWAQPSGGPYAMRKQVIAPGGRALGAGSAISATLGEPGVGTLTGGGLRLTGGFQTPRPPVADTLHADGFE
ncbi:MAG: hypothetical protein IPK27_15635 [Rhodanobacteraceae bacterium]|jgi:hypothetical protein|nr:hypothetical protein [Rhodanobacteraceae bacterium]